MTNEKVERRDYGSGSIYKRGKYYWIAYQGPDGKQVNISSKSTLKSDAELLLLKRLGAADKTVTISLDRLKHLEHLEQLFMKYVKKSLDISIKHQSSYYDRKENDG